MTEIKICGITGVEDALFAAACGADALGFIFVPASPRYIEPERAKEIIEALPSAVARVGVFVNCASAEVRRIQALCGLDFLQLHGDETPEYCRQFPPEFIIKAISGTARNGAAPPIYDVRAVIVDARDGERYGGTGLTSDWELAIRIKDRYPLILSGGLREENIAAALDRVAPQAVDINSGVERAPGRKDHDKLRKIVQIIRNREDQGGEKRIFASPARMQEEKNKG